MGRVRSLRIAGSASAVDTNVLDDAGAVFHGLVFNVIDGALPAVDGGGARIPVRVYEDTTGTSRVNLIFSTNVGFIPGGAELPSAVIWNIPEGIWCKDGLRVEIGAGSTNMEIFVLYS